MWKSLPTRCPRFWTEYGCRNSRGRTVLCRNVSSLRARRGNPNWSGGGYGVREIASQRGVHGGHGHGHALSWSGASTQVERDAIDGGGQWRTRGGAEGGRRGGCRAVVAGDSEVGGSLDGHMHAGRIQDCDVRGESGARSGAVAIEKRPHCDEEVVKTFSTEEVYKNMLQPSRSGGSSGFGTGSTMYGGGAVRYVKLDDEEASVGSGDRKTKAADVRNMAVDPEDGGQNGGSKRNFLRIQSEFVWPRLLSQGKALAGADYRRRRTILDPSKFGGNGPFRQGSLREFTHHAASETFLITRLAFTLLKYLGIGTRWIGKFIRLSLYAIFLMPGFIQVGYFYYFDKRIHRSITYGDQPRNRFDLYIPPDSDKPKPVVIFITGGAWVIGYKAWGSLLAQQLVERDIIVACIDYRNFPQGSISDMISDVTTGIGYVYQNIENYGGDPNMVHLAGQSAGAHLAACALLMQAEKEISEDPAKLVWRASQMKSYMAISGGYNLIMLVEHFHKRGLYKSIMLRVMEGEKSLPMYSPEYMVKTPTFEKAVSLLPSITLFHGTADYSIPHEASVAFAAALRSVGARVNTVFYPDKTHTDLFLQDPMRGGKDELLADILAIVHANDEEAKAEDVKKAYFRRRLVPEILLKLARAVSPF